MAVRSSSTRCAACRSVHLAEIDRRLLGGDSPRNVSRWLKAKGDKIGKDSLNNHRRDHAREATTDQAHNVKSSPPASAPAPKERLPDGPLKRHRFALEYLVDFNATQAAIRAGYSPKSARDTGSRLLALPDVQQLLQADVAEHTEKVGITIERVLAEYARLGFSDMRDYLTWGPAGVCIKSSAELTVDQAAAVASLSETKSEFGGTFKLKLYDKKGALDSLARYLGLFKDAASTTINVNIPSDPALIRKEIDDLLAEREQSDGPHTGKGKKAP